MLARLGEQPGLRSKVGRWDKTTSGGRWEAGPRDSRPHAQATPQRRRARGPRGVSHAAANGEPQMFTTSECPGEEHEGPIEMGGWEG